MTTTDARTPHGSRLLQTASSYRPDVDGLRAIAVTAVVLFHAGLSALPGGYVGVDVFFVISGYLITRQVVSGVERSSFSFLEFSLRRVRRLLPAALCTTVLTVVVAILFLPPFRIAEIASSAAAASASVSNVFFWLESGYWAEASASQPLLHTWSLSVEEQFYLVWPLLVFLLVRWLPRLALPVILAGTVVSVAVTTYATVRWPDAAFYLTPFRTYEFAIGALCVWAERRQWGSGRIARVARPAAWILGIALVLGAMLTFDEAGTTFPGWLALVPTVGAALVIVARRPAGLDRALSNPVARYLGLRSYSLYLVHWPILVYAAEFLGEVTATTAVACLAATVVLAELQYRLVERPLRVRGSHEAGTAGLRGRARRFGRKAVPVLGVAAVVLAGSATASVAADRPEAYAAEVRPIVEMDRDAVNAQRRAETNALCGTKTGVLCGALADDAQNVLVIGDSIGPDGYTVARTIAPGANVLIADRASCPPLRDLDGINAVDAACETYNGKRLSDLALHADDIDVVVVAMRLVPDRVEKVRDLVTWIDGLGPRAVVLGVGAHYDQAAWQTIAAGGSLDAAGSELHAHLDVTADTDAAFQDAVTAAGGHYLDRWDWTCDDSSCRAFYGDGITDLVMVDAAHLTRGGARALGEALRDDEETRAAFGLTSR